MSGSLSASPRSQQPATPDLETLRSIERRVLWLASAIVHHANRVRENRSGVKVGGHQASSASMVSLMCALWFSELRAEDRVSVKPHASPALHAINYLLGRLDRPYLETLRAFGGLRATRAGPRIPTRSTTPPARWASAPPRRSGAPWRAAISRPTGWRPRRWAVRSPWWATPSSTRARSGRRSPTPASPSWARCCGWSTSTASRSTAWCRTSPSGGWASMFEAAGGRRSRSSTAPGSKHCSSVPAGRTCARASTRCPTRSTSGCCARSPPSCGSACRGTAGPCGLVERARRPELRAALRDLGGHDPAKLIEAYRAADSDRPTVVFAYTIKGWSLPVEGHPENHSALLTRDQMLELAEVLDADADDPWAAFDPAGPEAELCAPRRRRWRGTNRSRFLRRRCRRCWAESTAARDRPSRPLGASSSTSCTTPPRWPSGWSPSAPTWPAHQPGRLDQQGRDLVGGGAA